MAAQAGVEMKRALAPEVEDPKAFTENCRSTLPVVGPRLRQTNVSEDAVGKLPSHFGHAVRAVVESWDQRIDGRARIRRAVHVADVDFVEWSFADAEHERPLLLERNIGGALDELGGNAVGDACQGAHAARDHDHSVGGVRAAGNVGANIGVGLKFDLGGFGTEDLFDQIVAAADFELLGHNTQGAVGCDEVDVTDPVIALGGEQKFAEEHCAAGAGGGHGQVLRRKVRRIRRWLARRVPWHGLF